MRSLVNVSVIPIRKETALVANCQSSCQEDWQFRNLNRSFLWCTAIARSVLDGTGLRIWEVPSDVRKMRPSSNQLRVRESLRKVSETREKGRKCTEENVLHSYYDEEN